jgi:hypothetical protein
MVQHRGGGERLRVPCVVTPAGPIDFAEHTNTALVLEAPDPDAIADAVGRLARHPSSMSGIAQRAGSACDGIPRTISPGRSSISWTGRVLERHDWKAALAVAALWVLSPIDLIPEFIPVIGPLDDVVVAVLGFATRRGEFREPCCLKPGLVSRDYSNR